MAIDGHSAGVWEPMVEPPQVKGTVRVDGAACFPDGWLPGSWSIAKRYNHFVVVIKGNKDGQHSQSEYRVSDIKKKPTYSEKREVYALFFRGNITAYIKAPGDQLQRLNTFVQPLLGENFSSSSSSSSSSLSSAAVASTSSMNNLQSSSVSKYPNVSPVPGSPLTRSTVKNAAAQENAATSNAADPPDGYCVDHVGSTKRSNPAVRSGSSPALRNSGYQTRLALRRSIADETPSAGFSNLGNTCYMNAILQALLGQKPFCQELWRLVTKYSDSIPEGSLLRLLTELLRSKTGDVAVDKQELLRAVKDKVASTAGRFNDHSENDAHEFLALLLDQLKDEVKLVNDANADCDMPNPVLRNFAFDICHYLKCRQCNKVISREEQFFDLPVDITATTATNGSAVDSDSCLQALLGRFFVEETVLCTCKVCGGSESTVQHRMTKLPRILILHVKRYKFNEESCNSEKAENVIAIPSFLTLQDYCVSDAFDCLDLTASVKKVTTFSLPPDGGDAKDNGCLLRTSKASRRLFVDEPSTSASGNFSESMEPSPRKRRLSGRGLSSSSFGLLEEDDDTEYNKQLMEAIRQSLMESNKTTTSDSLDSVDVAEHFATLRNEIAATEMEKNEKEGFLPRSFRLCAVVSHIGVSSITGHYISDVYDWKEKEWYCYDDSTVSKTSESRVQRKREKCGYIFFYVDKKLLSEQSTDSQDDGSKCSFED